MFGVDQSERWRHFYPMKPIRRAGMAACFALFSIAGELDEHRQSDEVLLGTVMQVAFEAAPFLVGGRDKPAARIVPWCDWGRKPDVKFPLALYGKPLGSGSTTKVGRLSLREPRP